MTSCATKNYLHCCFVARFKLLSIPRCRPLPYNNIPHLLPTYYELSSYIQRRDNSFHNDFWLLLIKNFHGYLSTTYLLHKKSHNWMCCNSSRRADIALAIEIITYNVQCFMMHTCITLPLIFLTYPFFVSIIAPLFPLNSWRRPRWSKTDYFSYYILFLQKY